MALIKTKAGRFKIRMQGFENFEFTEIASEPFKLSDAVKFAASKGGVLPSVREAAAIQLKIHDRGYGLDKEFATRTCVIYFKKNEKWYAAFDDSRDPKENIILARSSEGYYHNTNSNYCAKPWILPKADPHIIQILKRAEDSGRIVEAEGTVELSTRAVDGKSEYGSNKVVKAALGDLSEKYARFLNVGTNYNLVATLSPETHRNLLYDEFTHQPVITDLEVIVNAVSLLGDHCFILRATGDFTKKNHPRAVFYLD